MLKNVFGAICLVVFFGISSNVQAQDLFQEASFKKVENKDAATFTKRFENISWTGRGLTDQQTVIDGIPTKEIRARLQQQFGEPTKTVKDMLKEGKFGSTEGATIQFEYWFIVNDSIPMMVLDIDGPFASGLAWGGASRYIDLMPQIKRDFSSKLMSDNKLGEYMDYFFSPELQQWFKVQLKGGKFETIKSQKPNKLN